MDAYDILRQMKQLSTDTEKAHAEADDLMIALVKHLSEFLHEDSHIEVIDEIVQLYSDLPKWYS